MPSACWIEGKEVATTWMSRIAMNMPRHIRTKPSQVAAPGAAIPVRSLMTQRKGAVFGANPDRQHGGVEDGEDRGDPWQVEHQRQHRDLGGDDGVIGMRQEAIGAGRYQMLSGHHDDPRGPARSQGPEYPAAKHLQHERRIARRCRPVDRARTATAI